MAESQKALADRLFPKAKVEEDIELKNIPPEQRRLHTETADLTVSSLHQYMANGKIEVPDFQRSYVWTRTQASRLIESLLIQCPIPTIYFSQSPDDKLIVIDGNQRLLSIKLFLNDAFDLQGLTTYPELNNLSWSALDPRFRDHISNRTLRCITILKDTHPQIKFDVFERLNTGSVKLNAQELRHGLNHGPLMVLLDDIAKDSVFRKLASLGSDKRMRGPELVLRYFAFRHDRSSYTKPLSSFLDQFSAKYRNLSLDKVAEWKNDFHVALERVSAGLGSLGFRIFDGLQKPATNFNAALFDAEMVAFAETTNNAVISGSYDKTAFRLALADLMQEPRFSASIRAATSDEDRVKLRIDSLKALLNNVR